MNPKVDSVLDLVLDMLESEPSYVDVDVINTICGYTDDGEWLCETAASDGDVTSDLTSPSQADLETDLADVNLQFLNLESLFAPVYNALAVFNTFNPYDYIFYQDAGAEDGDFLVELGDDVIVELVELNDAEYYDDEVDDLVIFNLEDVTNLFEGFGGTVYNGEEVEADLVVELGYDVANFKDFESFDLEDLVYFYPGYDDGNIMQLQEEVVLEETIDWQDQVCGAFSFVLLALILTKIVLGCVPRSRTTGDKKMPLLTVAVEKQGTRSYVPPSEVVVGKAVSLEKLDREPYIVFI